MGQISYMFVGAGIGAYPLAIFHLVTHAFFKALLFLAAGSSSATWTAEQDIRKISSLAEVDAVHALDFPDRLALRSQASRSSPASRRRTRSSAPRSPTAACSEWMLYIGALLGALLTGLYTFRLYFRVFHGEPATSSRRKRTVEHSDEGARSMLLPVGILRRSARTLISFLAIPGVWEPFEEIGRGHRPAAASRQRRRQDSFSSLVSVALASLGIFVAWRAFQAPSASWYTTASRAPRSTTRLWFDGLVRRRRLARRRSWSRCTCADRVEVPVVQGAAWTEWLTVRFAARRRPRAS